MGHFSIDTDNDFISRTLQIVSDRLEENATDDCDHIKITIDWDKGTSPRITTERHLETVDIADGLEEIALNNEKCLSCAHYDTVKEHCLFNQNQIYIGDFCRFGERYSPARTESEVSEDAKDSDKP